MAGTLHIIPYAETDAASNMAMDELLLQKPEGIFLRLYGWNPPAISLGFGQRPEKEVEAGEIKKKELGLVRRMTGGRAILHDREVTYAIAADIGGAFGPTLHSAFAKIGEALKQSLGLLGIACDLEKGSPRDLRLRNMASPPCFASAARAEVVVNGKKLVGSAQKRLRRRFLQHGSLPLSTGDDLVDYLRLPGAERERFRAETRSKSCSVADLLTTAPTPPEIEKFFTAGFSRTLSIDTAHYALSTKDKMLLQQLTEKYGSAEWNHLDEPAH